MMTITMGCLAGHSACGHVCSLAPTPASGTALVPAGGLLFQRVVQCSGKVARVGATELPGSAQVTQAETEFPQRPCRVTRLVETPYIGVWLSVG